MTTTTATALPQVRPGTASPRRVRSRAVATALLATSALYLTGRALGTDFVLSDPGSTQPHPLILPEIIGVTLVVSLLGWGTLAVLERLTRRARTVWSVLAGGVLLLSLPPIGIEQATPDTRAMLVLIHVAVAAALAPLVLRRHPAVAAHR